MNWSESVQELLLSIAIAGISRGCHLRDVLLRRVRKVHPDSVVDAAVMRHWIPSGRYRLDAVLVTPLDNPVRVTLFFCHGIGETVQNWLPVQRMLASHGVASLVFDYAGYGKSSGFFTSKQAEMDTIAAFDWLRQVTPTAPIWLLGFSLGSGIAASVASQLSVSGLVLCAAFTSLREGAASCGFPGFLSFFVPSIWRSTHSLRGYGGPVLIVHGERDELFPVRMAEDLKAACSGVSTLVIVRGLAHDEPHRRPSLFYWTQVIQHIYSGHQQSDLHMQRVRQRPGGVPARTGSRLA